MIKKDEKIRKRGDHLISTRVKSRLDPFTLAIQEELIYSILFGNQMIIQGKKIKTTRATMMRKT